MLISSPPTDATATGPGEPQSPALHIPIQTTSFRSFAANTKGRDFAVGDIHGHFELLERVLARIHFEPTADRLFVTGDVIDRGPRSQELLAWLDKPWFHTIRGNHEQMVLDCMAGVGDPPRHARNGGAWFYQRSALEQQQIADRLLELPVAMQISLPTGANVGIIHAESPHWEDDLCWHDAVALLDSPDRERKHSALTQALYARRRISTHDEQPVRGVHRLYVGHSTTPQVLRLGNVVYIDTGCSFADGRLTAINLFNEEASASHFPEE
ncbi:phosphoprotein phosphatase [Pseudomonas sp. SDI]|uniref:metallophosphoesterase n=1 Tax=Pseudomonas sp. SDI TaxID=2170734 RepID=UPI000DE71F7E|nr:metallophosphoesterase [Pseudomonas sp. SDI]PWB35998.1 phosphoprotein phosphatase [Pseudomonas sp. SDI]